MKLIQPIVHNDGADAVINALLAPDFGATHMASTNGFASRKGKLMRR